MAQYATLAQLRIRNDMTTAPTVDEQAAINQVLEAASRNIDRFCKRPEDYFAGVGVATTKYVTSFGETHLRIPYCTSVTSVAVKGSLTATTYTAWVTPTTPYAGDGDWLPALGSVADPIYNTDGPYDLLLIDLNGDYGDFLDGEGYPMVEITAVWGDLADVPADIREACLMIAGKWWKQYQVAQSNELGSIDLGTITYKRGMDSGVKQILIDGNWILPLYGD